MHFLIALFCLAALFVADDLSPTVDPRTSLLGTLAGMLLVVFAAGWGTRTVCRRVRCEFPHHENALRSLARWKQGHAALWSVFSAVNILVLRWPAVVSKTWRLENALWVDEILILAPLLLPLVGAWCWFYDVDRTTELVAAVKRGRAVRNARRLHYVLLHARVYFGLILLPLFLMVTIRDVIDRVINAGLLAAEQTYWIYGLGLFAMSWSVPQIMRLLWRTESLSAGPLRQRVFELAQVANVRVRDVLVWKTGHRIANALVTGMLPWRRYVIISDGLLRALRPAEIEAIVLHEAAHLKHHHLLLRLCALTLPLSMLVIAAEFWPQLALQSLPTDLSLATVPLALLAAGVLYVLICVAAYCRHMEHEADLQAAQILNSEEPLCRALESLADAGGCSRDSRGWLHPSIARRTAFLQGCAKDHAVARRFRYRTTVMQGVLLGISVAAPWIFVTS